MLETEEVKARLCTSVVSGGPVVVTCRAVPDAVVGHGANEELTQRAFAVRGHNLRREGLTLTDSLPFPTCVILFSCHTSFSHFTEALLLAQGKVTQKRGFSLFVFFFFCVFGSTKIKAARRDY